MHDAEVLAVGTGALVRVVQPLAHADDDGQHLGERNGALGLAHAPQHGGDVLAVHVLHGQKVAAVDDAELEDLDDVGVLQRRRQPRLVEEQLDHLLVERSVLADALDDGELLESLDAARARQEDIGHSAAGQMSNDFVFPEIRGNAGRNQRRLFGSDGGLDHGIRLGRGFDGC